MVGAGGEEILLWIPKLRSGSYYPSFLEPRHRAQRTLLAGEVVVLVLYAIMKP